MAKFVSIISALNGKGLSGTLGDRVYGNWKGISYSRSKPVSVKDSRTPAQVAHRAKFSVIVKFLKPLKEFLRVGFESKAKNMSPFNYATSHLYKNALTGVYPDFSIDYSSVLLSAGKLDGALEPKLALISACQIELTWKINVMAYNYLLNDKAMVVVYNTEKQAAVVITEGNLRASMRQLVQLPESFAGDKVVCYLAFREYYGKHVSDSQFIGSLKLA